MLHQLHAAEIEFQHQSADRIHDQIVRRHIEEQTAGRRRDRVRAMLSVRKHRTRRPRPMWMQSAVCVTG